jgi:hypothetical protein
MHQHFVIGLLKYHYCVVTGMVTGAVTDVVVVGDQAAMRS